MNANRIGSYVFRDVAHEKISCLHVPRMHFVANSSAVFARVLSAPCARLVGHSTPLFWSNGQTAKILSRGRGMDVVYLFNASIVWIKSLGSPLRYFRLTAVTFYRFRRFLRASTRLSRDVLFKGLGFNSTEYIRLDVFRSCNDFPKITRVLFLKISSCDIFRPEWQRNGKNLVYLSLPLGRIYYRRIITEFYYDETFSKIFSLAVFRVIG